MISTEDTHALKSIGGHNDHGVQKPQVVAGKESGGRISRADAKMAFLRGKRSEPLTGKRKMVLDELIGTERDYVRDLRSIILGYQNKVSQAIPSHECATLFGNIYDLHSVHCEFLGYLETCVKVAPSYVGIPFSLVAEKFMIYDHYFKNHTQALALLQEKKKSSQFMALLTGCQMILGHQLPLADHLLKPIQRLLKYPLLISSLLKDTQETDAGYPELKAAEAAMLRVADHINESKRSAETQEFAKTIDDHLIGDGPSLSSYGDLIGMNDFKITDNRNQRTTRRVLLYPQALVILKNRSEGQFSVKHTFPMDGFFIHTMVHDSTRFMLTTDMNKVIGTFQCKSPEEKTIWVRKIKTVMVEYYTQDPVLQSPTTKTSKSGRRGRLPSSPTHKDREAAKRAKKLKASEKSSSKIAEEGTSSDGGRYSPRPSGYYPTNEGNEDGNKWLVKLYFPDGTHTKIGVRADRTVEQIFEAAVSKRGYEIDDVILLRPEAPNDPLDWEEKCTQLSNSTQIHVFQTKFEPIMDTGSEAALDIDEVISEVASDEEMFQEPESPTSPGHNDETKPRRALLRRGGVARSASVDDEETEKKDKQEKQTFGSSAINMLKNSPSLFRRKSKIDRETRKEKGRSWGGKSTRKYSVPDDIQERKSAHNIEAEWETVAAIEGINLGDGASSKAGSNRDSLSMEESTDSPPSPDPSARSSQYAIEGSSETTVTVEAPVDVMSEEAVAERRRTRQSIQMTLMQQNSNSPDGESETDVMQSVNVVRNHVSQFETTKQLPTIQPRRRSMSMTTLRDIKDAGKPKKQTHTRNSFDDALDCLQEVADTPDDRRAQDTPRVQTRANKISNGIMKAHMGGRQESNGSNDIRTRIAMLERRARESNSREGSTTSLNGLRRNSGGELRSSSFGRAPSNGHKRTDSQLSSEVMTAAPIPKRPMSGFQRAPTGTKTVGDTSRPASSAFMLDRQPTGNKPEPRAFDRQATGPSNILDRQPTGPTSSSDRQVSGYNSTFDRQQTGATKTASTTKANKGVTSSAVQNILQKMEGRKPQPQTILEEEAPNPVEKSSWVKSVLARMQPAKEPEPEPPKKKAPLTAVQQRVADMELSRQSSSISVRSAVEPSSSPKGHSRNTSNAGNNISSKSNISTNNSKPFGNQSSVRSNGSTTNRQPNNSFQRGIVKKNSFTKINLDTSTIPGVAARKPIKPKSSMLNINTNVTPVSNNPSSNSKKATTGISVRAPDPPRAESPQPKSGVRGLAQRFATLAQTRQPSQSKFNKHAAEDKVVVPKRNDNKESSAAAKKSGVSAYSYACDNLGMEVKSIPAVVRRVFQAERSKSGRIVLRPSKSPRQATTPEPPTTRSCSHHTEV